MRSSGPALSILLLSLCAAAAVAAVLGPSFLLQPFTLHSEELIARSYRLDSWGRWAALVLVPVGAWLFALAWRRGGRWARGLATVPLLVLLGAGLFTGERFIEWAAFDPLETIAFVPVGEATHVADDEMVMGIVVGGEARAYPVRMMAYHHIANDRLADEPFVVTF